MKIVLKEVLMKLLLCILLVLCTAHSLGQQQGTPPQQQPPSRQMPPDMRAPTPGELASPDVQSQLQKAFSQSSVLRGGNVTATVDDQNIVLEGTVENQQQHEAALQLAQTYAGQRRIVDKIVVRQKT
jgi:BON domain